MAEKKDKVVVVESDASERMFLDVNLSKFGYEVLAAETTETGLELANSKQPDIIICDLASREMDGIEFCWTLRENSAIRSVPVVITTTNPSAEVQINGFRSGVDAFIQKPISMRILITRIESLIRRVQQIRQESSPLQAASLGEAGLSGLYGSLQALPVIEFLQFANMSKKNGMLIVRKDTATGKIGVRDGEIIFAEMGEHVGEEAAYHMAGLQEGTFEFLNDADPGTRNIHKSTMKLILDCCTVLDMENIIIEPK